MRNSSPVFAARASEVVLRPLRAPFHFNSELRAGEHRLTLRVRVCVRASFPLRASPMREVAEPLPRRAKRHAGPTFKTYLCVIIFF